MAPVAARAARAPSGRARARAREHALRPGGDEERSGVGEAPRRGDGSLRQRRVRLGAPRARVDGRRRATAPGLRGAPPRAGAGDARPAARRGRAAVRPRRRRREGRRQARRPRQPRQPRGRGARRRQDGRGAARREPAPVRGDAAGRRRRRGRLRGRRGESRDAVRRRARRLARARHRPGDARTLRRDHRERAHGLLERPDGRLRVAALRRGDEGGRAGGGVGGCVHGRRRWRLGSRVRSSASPTASRGSRPAAARRSSCSRARSSRASRRFPPPERQLDGAEIPGTCFARKLRIARTWRIRSSTSNEAWPVS